ncbi:MAG TPA: GT-D fold domain-containing glycosyltransferase [Bacillota bacterium]
MAFKDFPDQCLMNDLQVLEAINAALAKRNPFSLVRVGDGENIILAQQTLLSIPEVMNSYWVRQSESGKGKGVTLPNFELRDQMITAIKKADIVGVCRLKNDPVSAPRKYKRELTNALFDLYRIQPSRLCHVFVNRQMVSRRLFWKIIHRYRTLLISKWWQEYAQKIIKQYPRLKPNICGGISLTHFDQIPAVLKKVQKCRFDLALISTGVNALVLASEIAEHYGKVAIDFGKTMMYTVRPCNRIKPWLPKQ